MSDKIKKIQIGTTSYDIEPAISSTLQVDNAAPTLAWNTTSVVGTVDGTDLTVKLPANPVPSSLKNPNSLTIKANSDSTGLIVYDGSAAKTFIIKPSTTAGAFIISDGTTEKTIQLAGKFTDNNTTYSVATTSANGLMSKTDKSNLDTLVAAWTADGTNDTLINKIQEVLTAFENAPEGTNIVTALASKFDKTGGTITGAVTIDTANGVPLHIKPSQATNIAIFGGGTGDNGLYFTTNSINHSSTAGTVSNTLNFPTTGTYTYTLPSRTGTLATTDQLQTVNNGKLTLNVGGAAVSGNDAFTANDATNTTYNVPSATASAYGVVKVSSVNSSAVTVNSESTTAGRYYPVELNSDGKAIVNVPWTDTNTNTTYSAGTGLQLSGTTFSAKLNSTTSLGTIGTTSKLYAVGVDANGKLCVNVPWTDTDTNTDTKVTQNYSTTSNSYPLLMTATAGITSTSSRGATTSILSNKLYANPSTGAMNVKSLTADNYIQVYDAEYNSGATLGVGLGGWDEEGTISIKNDSSEVIITGAGKIYWTDSEDNDYTINFPTKTGTLALTSDIKSLVSNTTSSGGIKYITEASFTNGVLTLESKYLHLS